MKSSIIRKRQEKLRERFSRLMGYERHFNVHTHFMTGKRTLQHISPELLECIMSMRKLEVRPIYDGGYDEIVNLVLTKVTTDVLDE